MTIDERLSELRKLMQQHKLNAYLIPSSDPHQSEYVAKHWEARAWISGFTGSAGLVIVTADHAGLWTDSRYFIQAEQQLANSSVELHKLKVPHMPEHVIWLKENLESGAKLGFDGRVVSQSQYERLEKALSVKSIELDGSQDLIGDIWQDRPAMPQTAVYTLSAQTVGEDRKDKIARVRKALDQVGLKAYLFSQLDDIAWLLNLRASDVTHNPLAYAYFLIDGQNNQLFIDNSQLSPSIKAELETDDISIYAYNDVAGQLYHWSDDYRLGVDKTSTSSRFYQVLGSAKAKQLSSPSTKLKAIKNETEIASIREVMRHDGVALLRLFRWLEETLGQRTVTEVEVGKQLASFRSQGPDYVDESFSAIVGYRGNGAIIHYRAEPGTCAEIQPEGMLLIDSGGQYKGGTTDVTRTIHLSSPSAAEKKHFTLVLQGYIALDRVQFPAGTCGAQLDILARHALWQEGLNYGHGTGHGVGFFLNVHEGPQSISPNARAAKSQTAFESGMVTSNEPGYYLADQYGIRTENLVLCKKVNPEQEGSFLCFEALTLFPIDRKLVDFDLLTEGEKIWLQDYHSKVWTELSPLLDEAEKAWLQEACSGW